MAYSIKKFLDSSGIRHFVNLLNNYPNNEILSTVIDAIQDELDNKKSTQTAVSSPSANGNALAFIDEISQDTQGVITATKKNVTVDATPTANSTNPVQSGGVKSQLDIITEATYKRNFTNAGLNTINFDETHNYNYCAAYSTAGYGTRPFGGWFNLINFNSIHFTTQLAQYINSSGNEKTRFAIRYRYGASAPWSNWVEISAIPITANMGTITGTGSTVTVTKTVTGVTAKMTVDRIEFGTPSAVQSSWTVITATDSVTFSATISGSTTVKVKLSDNTDVTGT